MSERKHVDNPTITGSCLCQGVTYRIHPPYVFFQYCHCSRCRKRSGSAHSANILLAASQLSWTRGEELVKRFELPAAKSFCSGFCTVCGSAVPWLTRNGRWFVVPAGTLDDHPESTPERNIYFESRAAWYEPASELPTFSEIP